MAKLASDIAKKINSMSGVYSGYDIFTDWTKALALSISNCTDLFQRKVWQDREEQYLAIAQKHGEKTMDGFAELTAMLTIALDEEIYDVLGNVYMQGGFGNKTTGQFFTPFNLTLMTAQLTVPQDISYENPLKLCEPCTGAGAMIIAAVRVLKDRGLNPQRCMYVTAQDLDWKGVYMTYVQLSLLGIKAVVAQGDTLTEPYNSRNYPPERVLYTPAKKGLLI